MTTVFCIVAARKPEVNQRVEVDISHCIYMAATSAIAAIGAAKFLVLFMAERDTARPSIASSDVNKSFINKLHGGNLVSCAGETGL